MKKRKAGVTERRGVTEPRELPPGPRKIRVPLATLLRVFVLGSVAVIACIWALWRYYAVPRAPMLRPAPPAASTEHEVDLEPP